MGLNSITFLAAETGKMGTALLNSVLCITIVFIILIIICLIISLFKYIAKAEDYFKKKNSVSISAPEMVSEDNEFLDIIEEEELSDDNELVAVIIAAIHAYEESKGIEVPADGIVVRSIKKANKSRWQNA